MKDTDLDVAVYVEDGDEGTDGAGDRADDGLASSAADDGGKKQTQRLRLAERRKEAARELKQVNLCAALCNYSRHGLSVCENFRKEHPAVSFLGSPDIYFLTRSDRLTILMCLLLGDMFIGRWVDRGVGRLVGGRVVDECVGA